MCMALSLFYFHFSQCHGWSVLFDWAFLVTIHLFCKNLRNKFDFWNVHGIMNTFGLLQKNDFIVFIST